MADDLSAHHQPITDLFPQPVTLAEWASYRLSDEQIYFFRETGYVAGIRVLSDEQIEKLRALHPRKPLLKGGPSVPGGNEMGGRFFPLLLESAATE